ncbi:ciliary microtubule-associated protein 3-like [Glandiceps talaboti]
MGLVGSGPELLGRDVKRNVSFGTSSDRPVYPSKVPPTRAGVVLKSDSTPNVGPGTYSTNKINGFMYTMNQRVTSLKGYPMVTRTMYPKANAAYRKETPSVNTYFKEVHEPMACSPALKPFNTGALRFPKVHRDHDLTPGPGTYEHNVPRNRKVGFHGTFGGPQLLKIPPDGGFLLPEECKGTTYKSRLMSYKDARKFKIREAYLSLYWKD